MAGEVGIASPSKESNKQNHMVGGEVVQWVPRDGEE